VSFTPSAPESAKRYQFSWSMTSSSYMKEVLGSVSTLVHSFLLKTLNVTGLADIMQ
jgi:hypothetical protein